MNEQGNWQIALSESQGKGNFPRAAFPARNRLAFSRRAI
jgi:hypothetical protein